jgi:hypothetical protein
MTLREAAQQALEALEQTNRTGDTQVLAMYCEEVIPALRAALADPRNDYERGFVDGMSNQAKSSVDRAVNAMARKPLTDDEIAQLMFKCDVIVTGPTQFNFARAIERAHGIKGEA